MQGGVLGVHRVEGAIREDGALRGVKIRERHAQRDVRMAAACGGEREGVLGAHEPLGGVQEGGRDAAQVVGARLACIEGGDAAGGQQLGLRIERRDLELRLIVGGVPGHKLHAQLPGAARSDGRHAPAVALRAGIPAARQEAWLRLHRACERIGRAEDARAGERALKRVAAGKVGGRGEGGDAVLRQREGEGDVLERRARGVGVLNLAGAQLVALIGQRPGLVERARAGVVALLRGGWREDRAGDVHIEHLRVRVRGACTQDARERQRAKNKSPRLRAICCAHLTHPTSPHRTSPKGATSFFTILARNRHILAKN